MSVYLPKGCVHYRYDFTYKKRRYSGSTECRGEADAIAWVDRYRAKLERRARGLEPRAPEDTPRIGDWAAVYFKHVSEDPDRRVSRPDRIADLLRVVLRFWGARPSGKNPKNPPKEGEPYKDLRLGHPIENPDLIVEFEEWMDRRGIAGQTKNQYRSVMNQMYVLAHQPKYRKLTGVTKESNPFAGIFRSRTETRDVALSTDDVRRLLMHASYHLRLATAIGALAPKLRLGNILALRWSVHFDRALTFITIERHKTRQHTGRPLVTRISQQLRRILQDARRRNRSDYLITYQGKPIKSLRGSLAGACRAAGLPYGRATIDGTTFHTLRHTAATMLAELDVGESKRKTVMGHTRLETTQRYTHLRPVHEEAPLEELSAALPIEDLVTVPWRRASRKPAGKSVGVAAEKGEKPQDVTTASDSAARRGRRRQAPAPSED